MAEPMTTTISGWFEEHGDFPENLPRNVEEGLDIVPFTEEDAPDVDLPEGYRWANEDECEVDCGDGTIPGSMMVTRTFDSQGNEYTHGEASLAVPIGTDLDYEPCCYASTMHFGQGDHEWGCPNY